MYITHDLTELKVNKKNNLDNKKNFELKYFLATRKTLSRQTVTQ